jgi:hypothetical protein
MRHNFFLSENKKSNSTITFLIENKKSSSDPQLFALATPKVALKWFCTAAAPYRNTATVALQSEIRGGPPGGDPGHGFLDLPEGFHMIRNVSDLTFQDP